MKISALKWLPLLLVCAWLGSSCSTLEQNPEATSTSRVKSTSTVGPAPTLPTATSSPTSFPINHLERVCEQNWITTSDTSGLAGSLVYAANIASATINGAFVLDLSTLHTRHIFKGVGLMYSGLSISSKQDAIAAVQHVHQGYQLIQQRIWIAIPGQYFIYVAPEGMKWPSLHFLDSRTILWAQVSWTRGHEDPNGATDKFYALSLDDGKFVPGSVFLPSYSLREAATPAENDNYDPPWEIYSPDFKYIAYPIRADWDKNYILNIENGKTIPFDWAKIGFAAPYPFWRPDSQVLTIVKQDGGSSQNFFNISLNGTITQLTRLQDVAPDGYDINGITSTPAWSPNNRYLAFPIYTYSSGRSSGTVYVLDTQTGTILDLCYSEAWPGANVRAAWSPDSRYFATDIGGRTRVFDLSKRTIYNLDAANQFGSLAGWLNWEIP